MGWTDGQVLQGFLALLPVESGSVADPLGVGVGVTLTRADVVARVRLKFAQLGQGHVSLVTEGRKKSRRKSGARSNAKEVRCFVCITVGNYA